MPSKPPSRYGWSDERGYRIRWAIVTTTHHGHRERMCIAERKVRVLGIFSIWWPVADWRRSEHQARADADYDIALRAPLPTPVSL